MIKWPYFVKNMPRDRSSSKIPQLIAQALDLAPHADQFFTILKSFHLSFKSPQLLFLDYFWRENSNIWNICSFFILQWLLHSLLPPRHYASILRPMSTIFNTLNLIYYPCQLCKRVYEKKESLKDICIKLLNYFKVACENNVIKIHKVSPIKNEPKRLLAFHGVVGKGQ